MHSLIAFVGGSQNEVARVASPSGIIDAVVAETNGGATTSFGYRIYVVRHGAKLSGEPVAALYGATRNDHAYGVNLRWESSKTLAIEFLNAKSKRIEESNISIDGQSVDIVLRGGLLDAMAPSGGLLYNLKNGR
jgi:hypothetical protein